MNQDQYDFIQQKYGNLIYMVAHHISGDNATADIEDNVQDLWIAAMEAIKWFESQDGGKNGKFQDFKDTKGFDQYIKTCLWHRKAKKGKNITKKLHITNSYSIDGNSEASDDQLLFDTADPKVVNFSASEDVIEDVRIELTDSEKNVIRHILEHPDCMKDNGTVNISQIAKATNRKNLEVKADVELIKSKYNLTMM